MRTLPSTQTFLFRSLSRPFNKNTHTHTPKLTLCSHDVRLTDQSRLGLVLESSLSAAFCHVCVCVVVLLLCVFLCWSFFIHNSGQGNLAAGLEGKPKQQTQGIRKI